MHKTFKIHRDLSHSKQLFPPSKPMIPHRSSSISSNVIEKPSKTNNLYKKSLRKSSSKEKVLFQVNLKKSRSFEKNTIFNELSRFNKNLMESNNNNKLLISQIKRDFEKNIIHDEGLDRERLEYYFRFRVSSLIKGLGFQKYYAKTKNNAKIAKNQILMKKENKKSGGKDALIKALKTIVVTKSKYVFKEKIDFIRAGILNSIKYDVKLRLSKLQITDKIDDEGSSDDENKIPSKNNEKDKNTSVILKTTDLKFEFQLWKKKNNIAPQSKVFIIIGEYKDIRETLKSRGWIENLEEDSLYFDLKWATKGMNIEFINLKPFQMVNHFEKNASITTKGGLCRNLRNLIGFHLIDIDNFYPRCYELNDLNGFDDFIEDYKMTKVESILKDFIEKMKNDVKLSDLQKNQCQLGLKILKRKYQDFFITIDEIIDKKQFPIVTEKEWEYITLPETKENIEKNSFKESFEELMKEISGLFSYASKKNPQFSLNGPKSVWILKPAGLSRGRGIRCYDNIEGLLDAIVAKDLKWVAQKYIENPLIIKNRKFDIRQWVLVTDWNPLKIWFYGECYIRFCAEDYDANNLKNKYMHLSNNSIAKHSDKFTKSDIKGNMWTMQEFSDYLEKIHGNNIFYNEIQKKMKEIVIYSLKSAEDMISTRKNSFEMFGYDFMIDENFHPWLIEINCSPAMDYSTHITERLVKSVSDDMLKVLIDMRDKNSKETGMFTCIYENGKILI